MTLPLELAGDHAWPHALAAFDKGNRELLAILVAEYLAHPGGMRITGSPSEEVRKAIAGVILGTHKPDARGRHRRKLKAPANAAMQLDSLREQRKSMLADAPRIEATAEHRGCEVADVRNWINAQYRAAVEALAAAHGVSVATLKDQAKPTAR